MSRTLLWLGIALVAIPLVILLVIHLPKGCGPLVRQRSQRELAFEQLRTDATRLQAELLAGRRLAAPSDWWGRPCRVVIRLNELNARVLELSSAGADGQWGTPDDLRIVLALPAR